MTCCAVVAPRPPHSSGHRIAAHRPSFSLFCHALRLSIAPMTPRDESRSSLSDHCSMNGRHLLVEKCLELVLERDVLGRPGEIHAPDSSVRSKYRELVDFTFSADQVALRASVRSVSRRRGAELVRSPDGRARRDRHHARSSGAASSISDGPGCSSPRRSAAWVWASSTRWPCKRRWAGRSSRARISPPR